MSKRKDRNVISEAAKARKNSGPMEHSGEVRERSGSVKTCNRCGKPTVEKDDHECDSALDRIDFTT